MRRRLCRSRICVFDLQHWRSDLAKTKTKPGPKPQHGKRQEIHIEVPIEDLDFIQQLVDQNKVVNRTQWIIDAIKEKRQRQEQENG